MNNLIAVIGDPISNVYLSKNNLEEFSPIGSYPAGALSLYLNAESINKNNSTNVLWLIPFQSLNIYESIYINDSYTETFDCTFQKKYYAKLASLQLSILKKENIQNYNKTALLISHQNKGFLNSTSNFSVEKKFDYIALTSNLENFNFSFLQFGLVKIWYTNSNIYYDKYSNLFDIILRNIDDNVLQVIRNNKILFEMSLQPCKIVDACGSEESIISAFISALMYGLGVRESLAFSVQAFHDVTQKPKIQITKLML